MPPLSTLNKTALTLAVTQAIAMSSAQAATIFVNDFSDDVSSVNCTLHDAIMSANTNSSSGGCVIGNGDDEIRFENTEAVTITLERALPIISSNMEIISNGDRVTLNAADDLRILDISNIANPPTVLIENMTLTGANVEDSFGAGVIVSNGSTVTISNSTITGNTTNLLGGGVMVRANSTLIVLDSTISDNEVTLSTNPSGNINPSGNKGGGIYVESGSRLLIRNSTLENNAAPYGGGIFNSGYVDIATDSTLSGNDAGYRGGGIYNNNDAYAYITDSTVSGNSVNSVIFGGDLSATYIGGGIYATNSSVILSNSTVSGNSASGFFGGGFGGGISARDSSVTLSNSTVSANSANQGGGINVDNSSVSLTNSTVSGNSTSDRFNHGGGISASNNSTVTLSNSTVTGNSVLGNGGDGGGIFAANSSVMLSNSTVTGNVAKRGFGFYISIFDLNGGGIFATDSSVTLSNSIVAGNQVRDYGDELYISGGTVTASGNLFGSSETDYGSAFENFIPDSANTIATVDRSDSTALSSILAPLSNNGGPTQTHALVFGSPAIDAANNHDCEPTDQRGLARNGLCDIGSFEAQADEAQPEETFFVVPLPDGKSVIFGL